MNSTWTSTVSRDRLTNYEHVKIHNSWAYSWFKPLTVKCRDKLLPGLCGWLHAWASEGLTCDRRESRRGNVMQPGRSSSSGLYNAPWRSTAAPPSALSPGLWREGSLWDEHVYPALLTWFHLHQQAARSWIIHSPLWHGRKARGRVEGALDMGENE